MILGAHLLLPTMKHTKSSTSWVGLSLFLKIVGGAYLLYGSSCCWHKITFIHPPIEDAEDPIIDHPFVNGFVLLYPAPWVACVARHGRHSDVCCADISRRVHSVSSSHEALQLVGTFVKHSLLSQLKQIILRKMMFFTKQEFTIDKN